MCTDDPNGGTCLSTYIISVTNGTDDANDTDDTDDTDDTEIDYFEEVSYILIIS